MKLVENDSQRWKVGINIFVFVVALISFTKQEIDIRRVSVFEKFMIDRIAQIQLGITSIKTSVTDTINDYVLNINASRDNVVLKNEIEKLHGRIFEFSEIERENDRLRKMLNFVDFFKQTVVVARIVGHDSSSDSKMLRINKGKKDGITLLAPVVTSEGIVGYVYRLTEHFADIITILDTNNRIDAMVERTRSHGIVEGYTNDKSIMKYVTRTEPLVLNDIVISSGLGNIYPKGLKIGTISRIEKESYGITQQVEITPSVNFGTLEEVLVIIMDVSASNKKEWELLDQPQVKEP